MTDAVELSVQEFAAYLKKRRAELFFRNHASEGRRVTGDHSASVRVAMQRRTAAKKNRGTPVRGGRNPSVKM